MPIPTNNVGLQSKSSIAGKPFTVVETLQFKPLLDTSVRKSGNPHEYVACNAAAMQRFVLHAIARMSLRRSGMISVQLVVLVETTMEPKSPTATYKPLP